MSTSKPGSRRIAFTLTQAERSAFRSVIEAPFCGDDDDVIAISGPDVAAARRMLDKVLAALEKGDE